MPCLNVGKTLKPALHSILDQSMEDFELIAVDDGSTDNTAIILSQYCDPRIRTITLKPNRGIAVALNEGLAAARGKYIARMDADDLCYENRLRDQTKFLDDNKDISLVGTGADVFGSFYAVFRSPLTHTGIIDQYLVNNPFIHPTIMFRRELVDEGLYRYNEEYRTDEDYELWARLLPVIQTANLDHSSIKYRRHDGNNQSHPQIFEAKIRSLTQFGKTFNVLDKIDVRALAELQCSGFVTRDGFERLRRYAEFAEHTGAPKLGWLQNVFLYKGSYRAAMDYYDLISGYRPYWHLC
jgi:glycosyltransferase involved in cell wall biosynthesis